MKRTCFFPSRCASRGFTLVELLIVVACIGIAIMLAAPAVTRMDTTRVQGAARMLVADLELAQLQSVGNAAHRRLIVFNPAAAQYHVAAITSPATPITHPTSHQPFTTTFGQGRAHALASVQFDSLSVGGDDRLGFTAMGALDQPADARITLRSAAATLTLHIDAITGHAAVE